MTQLRQKMLEELQRRNYSHRTAKTYIRIVRDFAAYFHRSPDKLGPEHIRQYQAYLFQSKKLSTASVSQYVSAIRFLFVKTLRRHFLTDHIPFPKSPRRLPIVSRPLHPPCRHLEQSPRFSRRTRRDLPLQGLPPRRAGALRHNDTQRRRVHQALPAPRSTKGVSSHPPLRATGERQLQGQHRARQTVHGCSNGRG
jgi:hypothetical protein